MANHADLKNRNGRIYTDKELQQAASSLSERPLNINHDPSKQLPFPENEVLIARYENGAVECIIQVADEKTNELIESGEINHVSIEGIYLDGSKNTTDTEYPSSLHFQALALLTRDDPPGDPFAQILKESAKKNKFAVNGLIMSQVVIPKVTEAVMSAADQDDLPDSAFAFISPGGKKDDEGKTVPRSLRHLPFKGADGKPNAAHVRNALARLSQTDIPDEAKAGANAKLQAAAKELGIETQSAESLIEQRIAKLEARLRKAGISDDSDPDRNAIVDPQRNEDGTFFGANSLQNFTNPAASQATPQNENPVQNTETNIEIGREIPDEGTAPTTVQSLQNSNADQTDKPKTNNVGVGNPESTIKPKMDYPPEVNPLGITNQNPSPIADGMKVTKASSLMDALTNASTNTTVKVVPTGVSESKMPVTNQSEKKMSEQSVKESVNSQPLSISVKLEGATEIKQAAETLANVVKESQQFVPKPQAKVSGTEATQAVEESFAVKEKARMDNIARILRSMVNVKEDISSSVGAGALGQVWSPDMIVLPPDLPANLRRFVQVKEIPKGSKQVDFTTITTAEFGSLTEDTSPSDATQTITEISATPTETGVKQRISYIVMESATPDVVQAVERIAASRCVA